MEWNFYMAWPFCFFVFFTKHTNDLFFFFFFNTKHTDAFISKTISHKRKWGKVCRSEIPWKRLGSTAAACRWITLWIQKLFDTTTWKLIWILGKYKRKGKQIINETLKAIFWFSELEGRSILNFRVQGPNFPPCQELSERQNWWRQCTSAFSRTHQEGIGSQWDSLMCTLHQSCRHLKLTWKSLKCVHLAPSQTSLPTNLIQSLQTHCIMWGTFAHVWERESSEYN